MERSTATLCAMALVTLAAMGVFAFTFVHAAIMSPDGPGVVILPDESEAVITATSTGAVAVESPSAAFPTHPARLVIPSLGIDAAVQDIGVTARGSIGTPDNFTDVGWYVYGAVPGQPGTAIIDGHVDNGLSLAGVFKHLDDIQPGAHVAVKTQGGDELDFTVTNVAWYGYEDTPADILFATTSSKDLILVTCGGAWVPSGRTYDHRLVVTAVLDR